MDVIMVGLKDYENIQSSFSAGCRLRSSSCTPRFKEKKTMNKEAEGPGFHPETGAELARGVRPVAPVFTNRSRMGGSICLVGIRKTM